MAVKRVALLRFPQSQATPTRYYYSTPLAYSLSRTQQHRVACGLRCARARGNTRIRMWRPYPLSPPPPALRKKKKKRRARIRTPNPADKKPKRKAITPNLFFSFYSFPSLPRRTRDKQINDRCFFSSFISSARLAYALRYYFSSRSFLSSSASSDSPRLHGHGLLLLLLHTFIICTSCLLSTSRRRHGSVVALIDLSCVRLP